MSRRTFDQWLEELKVLTLQNLEKELEKIPEFDRDEARSYFKNREPPIMYLEECLAETLEDGVTMAEIVTSH